ncbi:MAG TPA: TonB-dependent receptor, partial [Vicinamibacterales bacterium]|nr:TonB-dependent receptor [Vicinamibacterales bacterium]
PGVTITVTNAATGVGQTYVTNAEGLYEAPFLSPGRYRVSATLTGFATTEIQDVEVNIGRRATADVTLKPAGVSTEVEVVARAPLVQRETATVGQVFDSKTLVDLPSSDGNVYNFLALNSNVTAPAGGNAPAFRLESGGSFAVSGTRPSSITFKIDGLTNTDPGFGTPTVTPSIDSIQEFQVQNNTYSSEYEGIGQVNVATKSGTSRLSGSLFEQFQNEGLQPSNPVLHRKTRLRYNQYGGTLGGPVWKLDKTFFFGSYQGRRQDTLSVGQTFVPTLAYRTGDFSAALGGCAVANGQPIPLLAPNGAPTGDCIHVGQIFDPATTIANPAFNPALPVSPFNPQFIRQPFPGNRIPAGRINDVAQRLFAAQLPDPNFGDALNNYTGEAGAVTHYDQYAVRVDRTLTDQDRIYGRVSIQNNLRINQPLIPFLSKNLQGKGRVYSGTWTRVLGHSAVNEFRVGYVRGIYGDSIDQIDATQFGIQNTVLRTLPRFFLSAGNLNYGGFSASVIAETQDTVQLADNFSLLRGRHALKAGFNWSGNRFDNIDYFGSNGTATFSGIYTTGNSSATAARENSIADFLLGTAAGTSLNTTSAAKVSNAPWAVYVQDDWKLSDRMTVGLGLRYEYHQYWKSRDNKAGAAMDLGGNGTLFVVDPQVAKLSNTPLVACCASKRVIDGDKNDFAPRVSVVFQPLPKDPTVVRVGYGLYYSDTTQFFNWGSFIPLTGDVFQGVTGDFTTPAATLPNLFPSSGFTPGGGVIPFYQSGVPPAIAGTQVIGVGGTVAKNNRTPYSHQWSVSVQREILPRMLLDVTYQGAEGRNLPTQWIFNQPPASPNTANFSSPDPAVNPFLRRPYACCSSSSFVNANILESSYRAATVKIDKRFADGFQFLSGYTWSRSIDQGSEVFQVGNTFNILSNSRDINQDRGRSTFDVPHRWVTSGTVELPFGPGKRWLGSGWPAVALGGFRVTGAFTLESGYPFTPLIRNRRSNTGYSLATERGDLVGDPYWSSDEWNQMVDAWRNGTSRLYIINPAAISLDYAAGTFGNIPRNFFRAPFGRRVDLSVAKDTPLGGSRRLEFRVDVINLTSERLHRLDLAQFVAANNLLTNPLVGSIPPYANMFNPRSIQLGLRVTF